MKIFLVIVFVLLGLALSAIILMQEGKSQGLGALSGTTDSYWRWTLFGKFIPLYDKPAFYAGFFSYPKISNRRIKGERWQENESSCSSSDSSSKFHRKYL